MKAIIAFIVVVSLLNMIEANRLAVLPKNYMKNMNKAILNACTNEAHKKVCDDAVYSCIKNNLKDCDKFDNFNKFNTIRTECIKDKNSEVGFGIILGLLFWVIFIMILGAK